MAVRLPRRLVLLQSAYQVGVLSVPVVVVTGAFIGMVLAVQSYDQLRLMHLETQLGAVINVSLVRELGPVLAATMLAGRVGSAIAAELGTMRVTEQIDALRALGADPIQHLVVPRFVACCLLVPMLSALADSMGILSGWLVATQMFHINDFHYWLHSRMTVTAYDVFCGLFKSTFFGAAIAIVSCHRGFHCGAGAQGVGRAATEAFVFSFGAILAIDFLMGMFLTAFYYVLWPNGSVGGI
jgi:phospholipid/cholesterol/gamma-HCH transport system permease protein